VKSQLSEWRLNKKSPGFSSKSMTICASDAPIEKQTELVEE